LTLFLNFWLAHQKTIQLLIKRNLSFHFLEIWTKEAIENYNIFNESWRSNGTPSEITYVETFVTGGLWQIINVWLIKDNPENPEQIVQIFLKSLNQLAQHPTGIAQSEKLSNNN
jgi:hypothetical protein